MLLATDSAGHALVFRTPDSGRSWTGPVTFGVPGTKLDKPWIAYSPTGVLGVGWRGSLSDGSYALLTGRAGRWLSRRRVRLAARLSGACLIGGGVWLALTRAR